MKETAHNKLRKMLEMLIMLSTSKYGRKKSAVAEHFGISLKTVNRYLTTFREVGLVIDNKDGYIKLNKQESDYKDLSELLHFSEDESAVLSKAIDAIEAETALKEQLRKKLYALYNFDRVATPIVQKRKQRIIELLSQAVREKKQAELIKYRSANSLNESNRIIEPFDFTRNFISVWAYEPESDTNKIFKISRITNVNILNRPQAFEEKHKKTQADVFRMTGNKATNVELTLSMKAYNLLTEEYPRAEAFCRKNSENNYSFTAPVFSFYGVGRFILGLPEDVTIIAPRELKDFLNNRIRNIKF
jgi:predicted DNA-binding transcriptional regulator YafY